MRAYALPGPREEVSATLLLGYGLDPLTCFVSQAVLALGVKLCVFHPCRWLDAFTDDQDLVCESLLAQSLGYRQKVRFRRQKFGATPKNDQITFLEKTAHERCFVDDSWGNLVDLLNPSEKDVATFFSVKYQDSHAGPPFVHLLVYARFSNLQDLISKTEKSPHIKLFGDFSEIQRSDLRSTRGLTSDRARA